MPYNVPALGLVAEFEEFSYQDTLHFNNCPNRETALQRQLTIARVMHSTSLF